MYFTLLVVVILTAIALVDAVAYYVFSLGRILI